MEIVQVTPSVVGSDILFSLTYRSPTREYAENIYASVYIDDQYAGLATLLEYEEPEFWEDDPGYVFEFSFPSHLAGERKVEIYVTNGDKTFSGYTRINAEESAINNNYLSLKDLWNGFYDRDPKSAEVNPYLLALSNGSMKLPEVIEHMSSLREFINARNHMLVYKTLHGSWSSLPGVLEQTDQVGLGQGNGNNNISVEAATGMPFGPVEKMPQI